MVVILETILKTKMGLGFVILIHLIAIFVISSFIAMVLIIITKLFSKEEKRKKRILLAGLAPYVGLFSFYLFGFLGSTIVSEIKDVDIGYGDTWYVPIKDNCKLIFIDLPEQAYLDDDEKTLIENVAYIQQTENKIVGKTYESIYFTYNIQSKDFQKYKNELDLFKANNSEKLNLKKAMDFYIDRRKKIVGAYFDIVGIISFLISVLILWILRKLILIQ